MNIMDTKIAQMKIYAGTRKKLKLLAAMRDMTMMDVMDRLVTEALDRQAIYEQSNADSVQQESNEKKTE
jgi:hypothetical protein